MTSGWFNPSEPHWTTELQREQGPEGNFSWVRGGSTLPKICSLDMNLGWFNPIEPPQTTELQRLIQVQQCLLYLYPPYHSSKFCFNSTIYVLWYLSPTSLHKAAQYQHYQSTFKYQGTLHYSRLPKDIHSLTISKPTYIKHFYYFVTFVSSVKLSHHHLHGTI